jgi:DNA-binding NarL/FixJ family response regulator
MTSDRQTPLILLMGTGSLQFAAVECFIRLWAVWNGLAVLRGGWDAPGPGGDLPAGVRLIIVCAGSEPVQTPDMQNRLKLLAQARDGVPVIVLSDNEDTPEILSAFRAGARGYISGSCDPAVALHAFSLILAGGTFFPAAALLPVKDSRPDGSASAATNGTAADTHPGNGGALAYAKGGETPEPEPEPAPAEAQNGTGELGLTGRQQEVLDHLCRGASNKLIGRKLGMAEATVKVHVRQIMHKLGASNRTQVALRALEHSQKPPPPPMAREAGAFSGQARYACERSWFHAVQTLRTSARSVTGSLQGTGEGGHIRS